MAKRTSKRAAKAAKTPARAAKPAQQSASGAREIKRKHTERDTSGAASASERISARIAELGDWRGEVLTRVRKLIKEADPEITEEWKWRVPVWSHDGIVCTGESYKKAVKLTFAKGAALGDPAGLFNASLEGNVRRAIDFHEAEEIDEPAFKELIRAAVAANRQ